MSKVGASQSFFWQTFKRQNRLLSSYKYFSLKILSFDARKTKFAIFKKVVVKLFSAIFKAWFVSGYADMLILGYGKNLTYDSRVLLKNAIWFMFSQYSLLP